MKIIFSHDKPDELKDLLGFVDADVEIKKIRSEIYSATRELMDLIGEDLYNKVQAMYEAANAAPEADPAEDENNFLIYNVQYPIAVNAWRMYVPSGDLAHTNKGRKMRNDDTKGEKAAFEWMINRDNEAMEKRYYKALDSLLNFLDVLNPTISEADAQVPDSVTIKWKDTEAFQKTHKLFVRTTGDFEEFFSIDSRLLLLKLQPGLNQCERDQILPRVGKEMFLQLKNESKAPTEETDEKLISLIKEACVYFALSWGIRRLRVQLLPEGVLQRYAGERVNTINTKVPEKLEAEQVAASFAADAEKVLKAIESHLRPAPTDEEIEKGVFPKTCFDEDNQFLST